MRRRENRRNPGRREAGKAMDQAVIEVSRLWADYKGSAARPERDRLILHYAPLVKYVASRVAVGSPVALPPSDTIGVQLPFTVFCQWYAL